MLKKYDCILFNPIKLVNKVSKRCFGQFIHLLSVEDRPFHCKMCGTKSRKFGQKAENFRILPIALHNC